MIACPSCGHQFELSDALTAQIREHLKTDMQAELAKRETEAKKKLDEVKAREDKLSKQREMLDQEVETKLKERLKQAEEAASTRVKGEYAEQMKEMQSVLEQRERDIKTFRDRELELRKEKRQLQEDKENAALEIARKLDEERAKVREEVEKKTSEQHRLKDLEKDKLVNDLKAALDDMKRKAEQGSMETQGEVLELDFESQLKHFFPHDEVRSVPKGIRGADLIHIVRTANGCECGTLLWEAKNTRSWSGQWIPKLKDDMIATRATMAVLVSVVLPQGVNRFGMSEGIWVSDPFCAIPLAAALRHQLIAINSERQASVGKNDKMEMLYQYLSGTQFKQKIEGIVEAFTMMQNQLNSEKRAMEKQWNEREKQIERVMRNTVGLYGDMQGIIGGTIPSIPALELETQAINPLPPDSPAMTIVDGPARVRVNIPD